MTEIEERRRRQTIRTLITEAFMFVVIVLLVVVLALVTMGYQINFEKGFEHSGLVQINSIPTGAAITVDGEGVFLTTNQSRTMVRGPHEISLSRDGYTSWHKTINVTEGMMYRLSYPRLYKTERESTIISLTLEHEAEKTTPTPSRAFISEDRKMLLLTFAQSHTWRYFNLNDDTPRIRSLSVEGIIKGDPQPIAWADNNNRLLVRSSTDNKTEWIMLNFAKPSESINITKEFGLDFSDVRVESGDKLLALTAGNLRELNLSSKAISRVLASDIESFVNVGSSVAYIAKLPASEKATSTEGPTATRGIFTFTIGDDAPVLALGLTSNDKVSLCLSEYYGDFYLAYTLGPQFYIYTGKFPSGGSNFAEKMKLSTSSFLEFTPAGLSLRGDSELIVASTGPHLAVFDAEDYHITTFTAESEPTWHSEYDFYTLKDSWLTVHDFDYGNPHALLEGVSNKLPATISENDRFLYYFDTDSVLHRDRIR